MSGARRAGVAFATLLFVAGAAVGVPDAALARPSAPPPKATLEALFTPGDAIDTKLAQLIGGAKREVLVLAFSFTNRKIAQALVAAHQRGVRVEVVADRAQTLELATSVIPGLARDGVPVWLDGNFGAAHNKVLIVDAELPAATVVTGSYNFTAAAQWRNAENVLIVRNHPALAAQYRANHQALRANAQPYAGER